MRTQALAIKATAAATTAAFLLAGVASAAPTVDLIWQGASSGSATGIGTATLDGVGAGDTVTLDIVIAGNDGLIFGGVVGLSWTPADLTAVSAVECPDPVTDGTCRPNGDLSVLWTPGIPGVAVDNVAGTAIRFDALGLNGSANAVVLGRIVFTVNAIGTTVSTLYNPIIDGIVISGGAVFPENTATIVPEPSTLGLLALGLGALGMVGLRQIRGASARG